MRLVALVLLVPTIGRAEGRQVSIGLDLVDYQYYVHQTPGPRFGSPQQHLGTEEIDVPVSIIVTPWLRVVPLVGFTVLSLGWNFCSQPSCVAGINQNAVMIGAGAQAFHRVGGWEGHAGAWLRVPIKFGSNVSLVGSEMSSAQLSGGETISGLVGVARRLGPLGIWFDAGYTHSIHDYSATELGLTESFGGLTVAGGVALW